MNKYLVKVTYTAVLMAITVILQNLFIIYFRPIMGNFHTFLTGSVVNMMLILSVLVVGVLPACLIGLATPIFALIQGHLANPLLLPFVAVSNIIICVVFWLLSKVFGEKFGNLIGKAFKKESFYQTKIGYVVVLFVSVLIAASLKYVFFEVNLETLIPLVLGIPAVPVALSFTFGYPQLVTALIGGFIAIPIALGLRKAKVRAV